MGMAVCPEEKTLIIWKLGSIQTLSLVVSSYEQFMKIKSNTCISFRLWKYANPFLSEVADARERVAGLKELS